MSNTADKLGQENLLVERFVESTLDAAMAAEQLYSESQAPWPPNYLPFDFCMAADSIRMVIVEGSQRYREVLRWTASSTFRPLDEIAAIRHNEDALPKGQRSTELYLLAIEARRADFILDEINSDVAGLADDRFRDFLANLLYRWGETRTPAMEKNRTSGFIGSPAYGHPASSRMLVSRLDSAIQTARHTLEEILALQGYPFTALFQAQAAAHHFQSQRQRLSNGPASASACNGIRILYAINSHTDLPRY